MELEIYKDKQVPQSMKYFQLKFRSINLLYKRILMPNMKVLLQSTKHLLANH